MRTILRLAGVFLILLVPAEIVRADAFELTASNGNISPTAASYGTVTLTLNSGVIHVDVSMASGYHLGDVFAFNVRSTGIPTKLAIWATGPSTGAWIPQHFSTVVDEFGNFTISLKAVDYSDSWQTLSFNVMRPGGFTSLSPLEVSNPNGWMFATHVFSVDANGDGIVDMSPINENGDHVAGAGFAAVPGLLGEVATEVNFVPEPSIVLLLALGVGAASALGYRFRD